MVDGVLSVLFVAELAESEALSTVGLSVVDNAHGGHVSGLKMGKLGKILKNLEFLNFERLKNRFWGEGWEKFSYLREVVAKIVLSGAVRKVSN